MMLEQERKTAAHKHPWSMMVRMLLCPRLLGMPVIKSRATCVKGRELLGTPILYRGM